MSNLDVPTGRRQENKRIIVRLDEDEGDNHLHWLTRRHEQGLLAISEYLAWMTRHVNLPDDLTPPGELNKWLNDLRVRLMTDVEFCSEMIKCLETDDDVKNAVMKLAKQAFNKEDTGFPVSSEMLTEALTADTNPECNLDMLWAQCLSVVQTTNRVITDVFEVIESASNAVELFDAMTEFPLIGTVKTLSGTQFVVDLIAYFQDSVQEGYAAQYTLSVENELACALFCACKQDCKITLERIIYVFNERVSSFIEMPVFTQLIEFVGFLTGINITGTIVVDVAFFAAWKLVELGNFLFAGFYENTLQVLMALATNDASNDWQVLCDDCPQLYCDSMDEQLNAKTFVPSATKPFGVFDNDGTATYVETEGGIWEMSGGYSNNMGCIKSTLATGVTDGTRLTVGVDLGSMRSIGNCSWRGERTANGTPNFASEWIVFLDDTGNLITSHDMGTTSPDYGERIYNPGLVARYVLIATFASGFQYRIDEICINYS